MRSLLALLLSSSLPSSVKLAFHLVEADLFAGAAFLRSCGVGDLSNAGHLQLKPFVLCEELHYFLLDRLFFGLA
jgi:hypothetical protein